MSHFHEGTKAKAFNNFTQDVKSFIAKHGGWHEAKQQEPFHAYVMRTRHPEIIGADSNEPFSKQPWPKNSPVPGVGGLVRLPGPDFKFLIFDSNGVVQNPDPGEFTSYNKVSESMKKEATPIYYNGKIEVYATFIGEPILSPQEKQYLIAIQKSLWVGLVFASFVAVVLGLLFGKTLTATLMKLTQAIKIMQEDHSIEVRVDSRSNDELGQLALAFNSMNQKLISAHKKLQELAIKDGLTGLFNRRYFDEQAKQFYEQAIRYNQPLSVVMADIDFFKKINDNFSHAMGDEVLCCISSLLLSHTRKSDVVARYGGEEFVIIFPNSSPGEVIHCCEKIRKIIADHQWSEMHPNLTVTMSFGLCGDTTCPTFDKMLSIADNNLYLAKQQGRNRLVSSLAN